jgi:hypothetical protein
VAIANDGTKILCAAPKRVYDGDRCMCATGHGQAFVGRIEEYERPRGPE